MIDKYVGYYDKRVFYVVEDIDSFEEAIGMVKKILKEPMKNILFHDGFVYGNELFFEKPNRDAKWVFVFTRRRKGEKEK